MSPAIILDMKIPRQRAEPHYVSDRVIVLRRPAVRYRAGRRKDHPQPVSESCTSQETLALCSGMAGRAAGGRRTCALGTRERRVSDRYGPYPVVKAAYASVLEEGLFLQARKPRPRHRPSAPRGRSSSVHQGGRVQDSAELTFTRRRAAVPPRRLAALRRNAPNPKTSSESHARSGHRASSGATASTSSCWTSAVRGAGQGIRAPLDRASRHGAMPGAAPVRAPQTLHRRSEHDAPGPISCALPARPKPYFRDQPRPRSHPRPRRTRVQRRFCLNGYQCFCAAANGSFARSLGAFGGKMEAWERRGASVINPRL